MRRMSARDPSRPPQTVSIKATGFACNKLLTLGIADYVSHSILRSESGCRITVDDAVQFLELTPSVGSVDARKTSTNIR